MTLFPLFPHLFPSDPQIQKGDNPKENREKCFLGMRNGTYKYLGFWEGLEGNGSPLQCSCLENPRDGEAWWAAIHGVPQSQTRLKRVSSRSSSASRNEKERENTYYQGIACWPIEIRLYATDNETNWKILSVQFSPSAMSDSLRPRELQHTRLPCPSPTPRAYSNSCP